MQAASADTRAMIVAEDAVFTAGLDLVNTSNQFLEDISDALVPAGSTVERNNYADIHGSCGLNITRELQWGRDRVRPWMQVTSGGKSAKLYQGVFGMETPTYSRGEEQQVFKVSGYDMLHLLANNYPGDTYVVPTGTKYLTAAAAAIAASGVGAVANFDGTLQDKVLPAPMVWALQPNDQQDSWLRIVNDLLSAINYRGLWVDELGTPRSEPYVDPSLRAIEWVFDTSDPFTDILDFQRTETVDMWAAPNWWRFVRTNMSALPTIANGGIYEPTINATNPALTKAGRIVRKPVTFLDAADTASLRAQGDRIVSEDLAVTRSIEVSVDPLPIAGHFDVVRLTDAGTSYRCQTSSWSLALDGGRGRWTLGVVGG